MSPVWAGVPGTEHTKDTVDAMAITEEDCVSCGYCGIVGLERTFGGLDPVSYISIKCDWMF